MEKYVTPAIVALVAVAIASRIPQLKAIVFNS